MRCGARMSILPGPNDVERMIMMSLLSSYIYTRALTCPFNITSAQTTMNASLIARNAARRAAVARPRASVSVRKYAAQPPPPPLGPPPLAEAETKGSSLPLILGALTAAGGLGYYYYSTTDANEKDVKQKAKELDHAARLQAQTKVDEGREKFDEAKVRL